MHYIKLTLVNNEKVLINLDRVDMILPNHMNEYYETKSTVITFRGEDDFAEVLEPLEEIEKMINLVQKFGGEK